LLFRTISFSEIILSLLGLVTPMILAIGLYYVLGRDIWLFLDDIRDNLLGKVTGLPFSRLTVILLIYAGLVLFVSAGFLMMRMSSKKIKSRKTFSLLLWAILIALAIFIFVPSVSIEIIWIASIPACYLAAHYFVFERKRIFAEITFSLLVVLVFLVQALFFFR
jgi:hypothetical protein